MTDVASAVGATVTSVAFAVGATVTDVASATTIAVDGVVVVVDGSQKRVIGAAPVADGAAVDVAAAAIFAVDGVVAGVDGTDAATIAVDGVVSFGNQGEIIGAAVAVTSVAIDGVVDAATVTTAVGGVAVAVVDGSRDRRDSRDITAAATDGIDDVAVAVFDGSRERSKKIFADAIVSLVAVADTTVSNYAVAVAEAVSSVEAEWG